MEPATFFLAFSAFPGIGPVRFRLLYNYFGSAESAWNAPADTLRQIGLGETLLSNFLAFRKTFDPRAYEKTLRDKHISVLPYTHPRYPKLLAQISDAPFLLYVKGKKPECDWDIRKSVAVVGTRQITGYGKEATIRIVTGLVEYGFTIVSGMAYGIDEIAHITAMETGGKTIAVLGCGIDIIAPSRCTYVYNRIIDGNGAVLSEMPLGLKPNKGIFPARNRIISGLSLGVLVIEGADDSGALITASYAADQGRDVFAVPGPITSRVSKGPLVLIKQGATVVGSARDVVDVLSPHTESKKKKIIEGDTKEESLVLQALRAHPLEIDIIVRNTGLTAGVVGSTVSLLEIKGYVRSVGGNQYSLVD